MICPGKETKRPLSREVQSVDKVGLPNEILYKSTQSARIFVDASTLAYCVISGMMALTTGRSNGCAGITGTSKIYRSLSICTQLRTVSPFNVIFTNLFPKVTIHPASHNKYTEIRDPDAKD